MCWNLYNIALGFGCLIYDYIADKMFDLRNAIRGIGERKRL